MSTRSRDLLGAEVYRRLARLLAAEASDFNELVVLAGLDPTRDFRHTDLAGTTMVGADLRGYDFSYSDFRDVDLTHASIAGALFEGADLAGTNLGKANGVSEAILNFAVLQDAPFAPQMVVIPAGSFVMGSPADEDGRHDNEGPQHEVTIAQRFAMGRYPVTFEEYDYFCEAVEREKPADESWGRGLRPVINVNQENANEYIAWLSHVTGHQYRLPTEAEWEYSCRAGSKTRFSWGDIASSSTANYGRSRGDWMTTEVGSYPANAWGLYDMHGNVLELVQDHGSNRYQDAPADGSAVEAGSDRWLRGGDFHQQESGIRSAARFLEPSSEGSWNVGFRVARTLSTGPIARRDP